MLHFLDFCETNLLQELVTNIIQDENNVIAFCQSQFVNSKGAAIYYGGQEYGSLLVQGGTFITKSANIIDYNKNASTAIVPGYEVVKLDNGEYTVVKK